LDISYNYLLRIDDAVFSTMPKLAVLDLSHNRDLKVMDKSFMGLENSLIKLGLENVSLSTVPEIRLKYLREFRLGYNELPSIPQELATNMSNLRMLDLSNNDLTNVPLMTQSLPHLRWVDSNLKYLKLICIYISQQTTDALWQSHYLAEQQQFRWRERGS